jgi:hypothetical protein
MASPSTSADIGAAPKKDSSIRKRLRWTGISKSPTLNASVVDRGVLTPGSRAERVFLQQIPRTPSVNHERRAFTDYQR